MANLEQLFGFIKAGETEQIFEVLTKGVCKEQSSTTTSCIFQTPSSWTAILDINELRDEQGNTLLHYAVGLSVDIAVLELLLACKGINVAVHNKQGQTPAHLAAKLGLREKIQMLLRHESCSKDEILKLQDAQGNDPISIAVQYAHEDCYYELTDNMDVSPLFDERNLAIQKQMQFMRGEDWETKHRKKTVIYTSYGFEILQDDSKTPKIPPVLLRIEKSRTKINSKKNLQYWQQHVLPKLQQAQSNYYETKGKKEAISEKQLIEIMKKGVPDELRAKVWRSLLPIAEYKKQNPELYKDMTSKPLDPREGKCLRLDICRTFINHKFFSESYGSGQAKLFRVLKALLNHNADLQYIGGMSFIAAFVLMVLMLDEDCCQDAEEDAFWILHHLFRQDLNKQFILIHLPNKITQAVEEHSQQLDKELPEVADELSALGVTSQMYAYRWYALASLTAFPIHVTMRVWDMFLVEGLPVLHRFSVAVMKMISRRYKSAEDYWAFLCGCDLSTSDIDIDKLIDLM